MTFLARLFSFKLIYLHNQPTVLADIIFLLQERQWVLIGVETRIGLKSYLLSICILSLVASIHHWRAAAVYELIPAKLDAAPS